MGGDESENSSVMASEGAAAVAGQPGYNVTRVKYQVKNVAPNGEEVKETAMTSTDNVCDATAAQASGP